MSDVLDLTARYCTSQGFSLEDLRSIVRSMKGEVRREVVIVHEDHKDLIRSLRRSGLEVVESRLVEKWSREWKFPADPFIEYEKSDEPWCRYFGIGREAETSNAVIYVMDASFPYLRRALL